jgi:23S rRNA (adenine2503-C2)-methyltransferase
MNPPQGKISLTGLSPEQLENILSAIQVDKKYASRLLYWVYRRNIRSFTEIDDIPKKIIEKLSVVSDLGIIHPYYSVKSVDGSVKHLFKTGDGKYFESVYIPDGKRNTICVSVQSGCRMGCRFCATGRYGWHGNLTAGEIISQVTSLPEEITHVVFMGMGEPCDNAEEVVKACRILVSEWGMAKGRANITISTVGVMPGLERLLSDTDCNITLSLHSPFPEERAAIIPVEKLWPAHELLGLIRRQKAVRKRRFTVAYVMINGVNDTDRHLEELKGLLSGTGIRVNLLPYHSLPGDEFYSSSDERMMFFKHFLVTSGTGASIRRSRGNDVYAACGMLAATVAGDKTKDDIK